MNESLQDIIGALCEEVGQPRPAADAGGGFTLEVDGIGLRFFTLQNRHTVFLGTLGNAAELAEAKRVHPGTLLADCMVLAGARFSKLATAEALTLEPDTGDLVLWRRFNDTPPSISEGLAAAESLLNEATFWKQWLGAN